MSVTFEHDDGTLTVDELTNGRRLPTVVPRRDNIYVLTNTWETAYPLDLVQTIFEAYGPRSTCHAIVREEDPSYVQRLLTNDLFAYFKPGDFDGKQILDFGCGSGASSVILGRTFPNAQITGVELVESSLTVARKTVDYYGLKNVMFCQSPSGTELPSGIDDFDFVIMSAVFEHLLPDERAPIMSALWRAVRPGGHLFINQTPNQLFPVELHTTMLPFVNCVPDSVAHWIARRFSKRVARDATWEHLLREGSRGATESEIMGLLRREDGDPVMLEPGNNGVRDRIDLYYANTNPSRLKTIKKVAKIGIKGIHALFGVTVVPDLSLAFYKPTIAATIE